VVSQPPCLVRVQRVHPSALNRDLELPDGESVQSDNRSLHCEGIAFRVEVIEHINSRMYCIKLVENVIAR
jgi:hypothetical protein